MSTNPARPWMNGSQRPSMVDVLQVGGIAAIGLNALFANRLWLLDGSVRVTTLLVIAAAFLLSLAPGGAAHAFASTRALWPWVVLVALDVGVRALTGAIHASSPAGALLYSVESGLLPVALAASIYIGFSAGVTNPRYPGPMYAVVGIVTLIVAGAEGLDFLGLGNPLASGLAAWNGALPSAIQVWTRDPTESFRTAALDIDPNFTGALGVVLLIWGVTWRGRQPRTRGTAVLTGLGIVLLSASRTALIASVVCVMIAGVHWIRRRSFARGKGRSWYRLAFLVLLLVTVILGTVVVMPRIETLHRSVEAVVQAGTAEQGITAADELTAGRLARWRIGIALWREHPFGLLQPPEWAAGVSLHNDFLERLVWGGPLLLGVAVLALAWTGLRRYASAPLLGPLTAVAWLVTGMALPASSMPAFACTTLFTLGLAAGADEGIRRRAMPDSA